MFPIVSFEVLDLQQYEEEASFEATTGIAPEEETVAPAGVWGEEGELGTAPVNTAPEGRVSDEAAGVTPRPAATCGIGKPHEDAAWGGEALPAGWINSRSDAESTGLQFDNVLPEPKHQNPGHVDLKISHLNTLNPETKNLTPFTLTPASRS